MTLRPLPLCTALACAALLLASTTQAQALTHPYKPHVGVPSVDAIPADSSWTRYFGARSYYPLKLTPDPVPPEVWIIDPDMIIVPDSSIDARLQQFIPPPVDTRMILRHPLRNKRIP